MCTGHLGFFAVGSDARRFGAGESVRLQSSPTRTDSALNSWGAWQGDRFRPLPNPTIIRGPRLTDKGISGLAGSISGRSLTVHRAQATTILKQSPSGGGNTSSHGYATDQVTEATRQPLRTTLCLSLECIRIFRGFRCRKHILQNRYSLSRAQCI
jgi:hypothetical protein